MNNYFTLRRANRLRVKLLNSKSQEQIREVIRYLRRTSWDECGVELIYSDLIDMAVQANENGQELFNVIEDAKTFAEEVKPSLKTLRTGDYFWFVAPLYFFFGWGIGGLLLYPVVPDWVFELSLGYLVQLVVCITAFCWLFRKMMEQAGFPPSKQASSEILRLAGALYCSAVCNRCIFYTDRWSFCFAAPADFALCPFQPPAGCGVVWHKILEVWQR